MEQKPFSIGVRIEHPQDLIDIAQYGRPGRSLVCLLQNTRSVTGVQKGRPPEEASTASACVPEEK